MGIVEIISLVADIVIIVSLLFIIFLLIVLTRSISKVWSSFSKIKNDVLDFINIFSNPTQISSSTIKRVARGIRFISKFNQTKK